MAKSKQKQINHRTRSRRTVESRVEVEQKTRSRRDRNEKTGDLEMEKKNCLDL